MPEQSEKPKTAPTTLQTFTSSTLGLAPILAKLEGSGSALKAVAAQIIVSHICELPKTRKQSNPDISYLRHMQNLVSMPGGFWNLTRGFAATAGGIISRQSYRVPCIAVTKDLFDAAIPAETRQQHPNLSKNLAIMGLALFWDPLLWTPLERLRVMNQTPPDAGEPVTKLPLLENLYGRGGGAMLLMAARQTNFVVCTFGVPMLVESYKGKKLSPAESATASTVGGAVAAITGTPLDVGKTDLQKAENPISLRESWLSRTHTTRKVYSEHGIIRACHEAGLKLFAGSVPRIARVASAGLATSIVVNTALDPDGGNGKRR